RGLMLAHDRKARQRRAEARPGLLRGEQRVGERDTRLGIEPAQDLEPELDRARIAALEQRQVRLDRGERRRVRDVAAPGEVPLVSDEAYAGTGARRRCERRRDLMRSRGIG